MSPSPSKYSPGIIHAPSARSFGWKGQPALLPYAGAQKWPPHSPTASLRAAGPPHSIEGRGRLTSPDRGMNRHPLGPVGERALDLHFLEHLRHPVHHVVAVPGRDAERHEVGDRAPHADDFQHL